ncbi:MAG: site-specific DNA-methyltransferase [Syntrophomonadaceae bacterium]|nr:site-specific DNA-methyltransferase [Syntrophomonadaceae bacterium]
MKQKQNITLIWSDKDTEVHFDNDLHVNAQDFIIPNMITEKTLFVPTVKIHNENLTVKNRLIQGDNLDVMQFLLTQGFEKSIDLIYIDPPYMSASNYHIKTIIESKGTKQTINRPAFEDTWNNETENYLNHIYSRLKVMYKLLKANGSIFVHLDWHISHYVKVLLDEIFTPDAFINEIVWCYSGGSGAVRHFQRKHDVILWYVKGVDYIFNPQYRPYTEGTVQRGLTRIKGDKYKLNEKGANLQDWWADINKILSPTARENLKFPTQKPISLIKRIIAAASNPGSLVADFYAGSATTAEVCEQTGRSWICCDSGQLAIETALSRLIKCNANPFSLEVINQPSSQNSLLEVEARTIKESDGEIDISINIKNYIPESLPENYKHNHPAALIHFWEIDLNHNGNNFYSNIQVFRKTRKLDDSLCLDIIVRIPARNKYAIAVRVHDLMGNITTSIVQMSTNLS